MPTPDTSALAELCSIFPAHSRAELGRLLTASQDNIERATLALLSRGGVENAVVTSSAGAKRRRVASSSSGGGLRSWLSAGNAAAASPSGARKRTNKNDSPTAPKSEPTQEEALDEIDIAPQPALPSAFSKLRAPASVKLPSHATQLAPLTLATPALVYKHTQGLCTLITDVLPKELAAKLFLRMLDESAGKGASGQKWDTNRWYLFDRQVESPHTTQFYVERHILANPGQKQPSGFDRAGMEEAAQYWYNGTKRAASEFVPEMESAREVIGALVRRVLAERTRHPLEFDGDWLPNVAAANCYAGRNESVGAHSDSLSYLGPYPTIASLSLGVERVFRLRGYTPASPSAANDNAEKGAPPPRTFNIPLPHNSLLIMHAGVQEMFKHSVPPMGAGGMDLFKLPRGVDGIDYDAQGRGWDQRINLTFRFYRPDFAPLTASTLEEGKVGGADEGYQGTPSCGCGVPCILRPDGRGVLKARLGAEGNDEEGEDDESARGVLSHFWQCNGGAQNSGKTCGFFRVLDMRAEGRGKWWLAREEATPSVRPG